MHMKGGVDMAQVNIRIDDTLKEQGEKLFNALGMTFSTAINITTQSISRAKITDIDK